ncbi:MAG: hypothetical protein ACR2G2_06010 [Pseudonocardia sp.]
MIDTRRAARAGVVSATRGIGALVAALVLAGCSTGTSALPSANPLDSSPVGQAAPVTDPVAFFRMQEQVCRAHAQKQGNAQVEPARFAKAKLVRALGGGTFIIADGMGTRLAVRPAARSVLPESGKVTDIMPAPYGIGCPSEIFEGASED